jgi:glycosyltransferase involved in cell wall biosynthesis
MHMQVSVVIITRDEQPRLRLCLASLARQSVAWQRDAELIIVDDGSATPVGTAELCDSSLRPHILRHQHSRGRSAARNAGAAAARGQRLLFLDGDVLLSPGAIVAHAALAGADLGRGQQRHLRGTRFFRDPRTGEPWPGKEALVRSLGDLAPRLITEQMIAQAPFEYWIDRSDTAIYPGAAPRRLYELEMSALRAHSAPRAEWLAAAGHNFSVPRQEFAAVGGFDEQISINEHRELALRLCRRGARVVVVEHAISVHITHREGWRDPLDGQDDWQQAFARQHPLEARLMLQFWRSLAADRSIAPTERLLTLEAVDALLAQSSPAAVPAAHPA